MTVASRIQLRTKKYLFIVLICFCNEFQCKIKGFNRIYKTISWFYSDFGWILTLFGGLLKIFRGKKDILSLMKDRFLPRPSFFPWSHPSLCFCRWYFQRKKLWKDGKSRRKGKIKSAKLTETQSFYHVKSYFYHFLQQHYAYRRKNVVWEKWPI